MMITSFAALAVLWKIASMLPIVKIAPLFPFVNYFMDAFNAMARWIAVVLDYINGLTHNYGWSMLLLALVVRIALMPLFMQQFKSMKEMQALAPYLKRLQTKYKNDRAKLQEQTMALYREHGVNPLGGCLPLLAQMPILFAVYSAISMHNEQFKHATWLWIGTSLSHRFPQIFANSLYDADNFLLLLYAVAMYFSTKLTPTAAMDEQQAQMMRTQTTIMPIMFFGIGLFSKWHSGFVLYWLGFLVVSLIQQWFIMRAPSRIAAPPAETPATLAGYPLDCPSCGERLVVVKGSKCEKCSAKVRKLQPSANGAPGGAPAPATQAGPAGGRNGGGARKGT
jgi:YidC/Oxa1 family membrane protein insertase